MSTRLVTFLHLLKHKIFLPQLVVELLHDVGGLPHHGVLEVLELVPGILEVGLLEEEVPDTKTTKLRKKYQNILGKTALKNIIFSSESFEFYVYCKGLLKRWKESNPVLSRLGYLIVVGMCSMAPVWAIIPVSGLPLELFLVDRDILFS